MSRSIDKTRDVEAAGMLDLIPYANLQGSGVVETGGHLLLQKYLGDFIKPLKGVDGKAGRMIEVKVERRNAHGNLYLETWSNRHWFTLGWMFSNRGDTLWYYFLEDQELYIVDMEPLKQWAFGHDDEEGQVYRFNERKQGKYDQKNDTWGRCVPIQVLKNQVKTFRGPINPVRVVAETVR